MMKEIKDIVKEILEDKEISDFIYEHHLSKEFVTNNRSTLLTQKERNEICANCQGKKLCSQDIPDMNSELLLYNSKLDFNYKKCKYKELLNEDYIELLFVPEQNYTTNLSLYKIPARALILKRIKEFMDEYVEGKKTKGMYIHGRFGVGKTFILMKLANLMADKKIKVLFVYYPDLVRSLKSSIGTNRLESYVEKLKRAEILMLDDFGAESNSSFIRDEVLGPILQYRANQNLPVFISSNLDLGLLRQHLEDTRDENNAINSSRIIERIELLTDSFELKDQNYRVK